MVFLKLYVDASSKRPLLTNVVVGFSIMFCGDTFSQTMLERKRLKDIDVKRLVLISTWNGLFMSPLFFLWFRFLDRKFPGEVMKKTLINQCMVSVPNASAFLMYSSCTAGYIEGNAFRDSVNSGIKRIQTDMPTIVATSALFWLPVNYLNFSFVHPRYRVLPSLFGGVVWGAFVTFMGHRELEGSIS